MKMKVNQFYNKNQFIITSKESVVFQSYDSIIAIKENDKLTLGRHWDYSNTTRKHLYLFLDEYCYNVWSKVKNAPSIKQAIQKLIDEKQINYDSDLQ